MVRFMPLKPWGRLSLDGLQMQATWLEQEVQVGPSASHVHLNVCIYDLNEYACICM